MFVNVFGLCFFQGGQNLIDESVSSILLIYFIIADAKRNSLFLLRIPCSGYLRDVFLNPLIKDM